MCFLLFFSSVIDPIVKQRQGAGRCNDVGMIVFDNVLVQDDVQETFLRTSRLDQLQPFLAFIGYDIDQRLVAFTFRKVQPCSRFRTPSVASRTGTVEDSVWTLLNIPASRFPAFSRIVSACSV